jgi:hypothetical protein
MKIKFRISIVLLSIIFISGCLITPHYYSGKTLKPGKKSLTFAANSIIIGSNHDGINIEDDNITISPQVGLTYGLPYRFEMGVQYFPPQLLEARLRWQINPENFKYFDASLDGTFGKASYLEYFKYGVTISKDIMFFAPYVYYSKNNVQSVKNESDDSFQGFVNDLFAEIFNISSDVGFGIAINLPHGATLYPEINYQIYDNNFEEGIFSIGAALRHDF